MAEWITVGALAQGSGVDAAQLAAFITKNFDYESRQGATFAERIAVKADQSPDIVRAFKEPAHKRDEAVRSTKARWAQNRAAEIVANMPHTSTATFEGYRITRYGGFATGTSTINTVSGIFASNQDLVEQSINTARIAAIHNLKQRAFEMGCNAVVGMDVDFVSVDSHGAFNAQADSHYIVVCANGTAVEIEPID